MALLRLGSRVSVLDTRRVAVLDTKAGSTKRTRGYAWMQIRRKVLIDQGFACKDCGHVSASNEIDHEVPLEQGGTDDKTNLVVRCKPCHAAKTADENRRLFANR